MPRRRIGQLGFMDAAVSRRGNGTADALAAIGRLVDWERIGALLSDIHAARKGEAAYPPLAMFKILLLQRWYGLSDPETEAALSDRLSFMAFAGFALGDATPDHTTIWRFRQALGAAGRIEALFAEIGRQLDARGLVLKRGTLVDASLITSAARRPRLDEGRTSPTDPDARFGTTNARGRFSFGYKLHVAVDQGSGLVRAVQLTPANVQEVTVAPDLLPPKAGTVYGDRGYDAQGLHDLLRQRGLGDGIMRRGRANRPISAAEIAANHALSLTRRAVERVFGTLKRSYRLPRMRAFSLARNRIDVILFAIALNLRRWRTLATG